MAQLLDDLMPALMFFAFICSPWIIGTMALVVFTAAHVAADIVTGRMFAHWKENSDRQ